MTNTVKFNVNEFHNYSQFGNTETMDEVIYEYKNILEADRVATSVIELLLYFGRKSLMIPGVSWKMQATIAADLGYSVGTIYNGLKKLMAYGMIVKKRTVSNWKTATGGAKRRQGVDIVAIQANLCTNVKGQGYDSIEADEANADRAEAVENKSQPSSYNQSFIKDSNTVLETGREPQKTWNSKPITALKNSIPKTIYDALSPFYDYDGLYKTYGLLLRAKAKNDRTIVIEEHADDYTDAFVNIIRKYKRGEVRNLDGLLYVEWDRLSAVISRKVGRGNNRMNIFKEALQ